jgi:hypothetical protein
LFSVTLLQSTGSPEDETEPEQAVQFQLPVENEAVQKVSAVLLPVGCLTLVAFLKMLVSDAGEFTTTRAKSQSN